MTPALNRLHLLQELGQQCWLEGLQRGLLEDRHLHAWVGERLISGVLADGQAHDSAIASGTAYLNDIRSRLAGGSTPAQIYEDLLRDDIRAAADLLRPLYQHSGGGDGLVTVPRLSHSEDVAVMLADARLDLVTLDRPNLLIEVPPLGSGPQTLERLLAEGIGVAVTPIFGLMRYRAALDRIAAALEARKAAGHALERVVAVTAFVVNQFDQALEPTLARVAEPRRALADRWRGSIGIAQARTAYQHFRTFLASRRWQALAAHGARPPLLLWLGTAGPTGEQTRYVDQLIGPQTITSLSPAVLQAYLQYGRPAQRLEDLQDIDALEADLQSLGIDLEQLSRRLETQAAAAGAQGLAASLASIATRRSPAPQP